MQSCEPGSALDVKRLTLAPAAAGLSPSGDIGRFALNRDPPIVLCLDIKIANLLRAL
jgi:hypothetical protein